MRAGLEVRLAGVDERVREDQHQPQPAARRAPAVVGQRQAVSELVDCHQRKPADHEHRTADQHAVGDDERGAEPRADDVSEAAEPGQREQDS